MVAAKVTPEKRLVSFLGPSRASGILMTIVEGTVTAERTDGACAAHIPRTKTFPVPNILRILFFFLPGTVSTISLSRHSISQLPHNFMKQLYLLSIKEPPQCILPHTPERNWANTGKKWEGFGVHVASFLLFIYPLTPLLQDFFFFN